MNRRVKLKHKFVIGKIKKGNIVIIIFMFFLISLILVLRSINNKVSPIILNYAELELRKLSSVIINSAVATSTKNINFEELFIVTKDNNGEIRTIDFNPIKVNELLAVATEVIQNNLKKLEDGNIEGLDLSSSSYLGSDDKLKEGVIFEIPSGLVLGNSFFSSLGPKVPVKISLIGDIFSEINTKVTNYGINNALVEVRINLKLTEQVFLPIASDEIKIETSIPLTLKLIQGTVPSYYLTGINQNSSSFSLPAE